MVEIRKNQEDVILSREQLKQLEGFQASVAALWNEMRDSVEEFDNVILRHYFNRENGFLDEQQNNLREVVSIQHRLDHLAGRLSGDAAELKAFLVGVQKDSQGIEWDKELSPGGDSPAVSVEQKSLSPAGSVEKPSTDIVSPPAGGRKSPLILRPGSKFYDPSVTGGEISIKLFFEELGILRPERREILREITRQLHDLLYERKLVGYSKTSLVFGRDKNLGEVLESLGPVFLSGGVRALLAESCTVDAQSELSLACNEERELVYVAPAKTAD